MHCSSIHAQTVLVPAHAQMEVVAEATPLIASSSTKCAMATFLLCSNVNIAISDYWQVWQRIDLVSRFARGSVASCLAGLSKRVALHSQIHGRLSKIMKMGPRVPQNFMTPGASKTVHSCLHVMIRSIIRKINCRSENVFCCISSKNSAWK